MRKMKLKQGCQLILTNTSIPSALSLYFAIIRRQDKFYMMNILENWNDPGSLILSFHAMNDFLLKKLVQSISYCHYKVVSGFNLWGSHALT